MLRLPTLLCILAAVDVVGFRCWGKAEAEPDRLKDEVLKVTSPFSIALVDC